ncbi:SMEK domain-containing protein [Methylocaldum marinum]|uniref:SMEK domain-containing protein n=1 Tax=Methylocaldum marinum TaxID=1432792 RepID=UPI0011AE8172|nr:SMEK domain-containing protein [Methylocaldum marinum]
MKHLDLINEFQTLLTQLRHEVESASAMQLYDTHKIAEQVICGVMRELYGFAGLRNLNAEQGNFPGIDLADDTGRIAVQVTATADLSKIKDTLKTFLKHGLHKRYDRLIVYILTAKQDRYSQSAIDAVTNGNFSFSADTDVVDYRDLSQRVPFVSPAQLQAAVNVLKAYLRGIPVGPSDEDIDPPAEPSEVLTGNLVELYFPNVIYVAQVANEIMEKHRKGRARNLRRTIGEFCRQAMTPVPSTYVTYNDNLVTFFDLNTADHPYRYVIEEGGLPRKYPHENSAESTKATKECSNRCCVFHCSTGSTQSGSHGTRTISCSYFCRAIRMVMCVPRCGEVTGSPVVRYSNENTTRRIPPRY